MTEHHLSAVTWLLFAHLIGDYVFQNDFQATMKAKYNSILLVHCSIWGITIAIVLAAFGYYQPWMLWWLILGHAAMDYAKCRGHLARWIASAWFWIKGYQTNTEGFSPEARDLYLAGVKVKSASCDVPWAVDPLGLPLWIDQAFHLFQIYVCVSKVAMQ